MRKALDGVLSRKLPIPLYYQIVEYLRDRITAGELLPGEQLPPERELSKQFGVSRMTARQAIAYLVNDGVLEVRHGQGTFVAEPKLTYQAPHLMGFTESMLRKGKETSSSVLEQVQVPVPLHVAPHLGLALDANVVKIVRVRRMEGVPLLLERIYVPSHLCPGLETADLGAASLYALFEEHYRLQVRNARQTLATHIPDESERELLQMPMGIPIITLEGVTFLATEQPIEYFIAHYRGDRFKFAFESSRETFDNAESSFSMMLDGGDWSTKVNR
jgi:GntR family transcriptional regulator